MSVQTLMACTDIGKVGVLLSLPRVGKLTPERFHTMSSAFFATENFSFKAKVVRHSDLTRCELKRSIDYKELIDML